jgi:hypothetical protein
MRTNLKTVLAAIGIAVLMSPVMAETRTQSSRHASGSTGETNPAATDCVHVAFPQCSGGNWRRARVHKAHAVHKSHTTSDLRFEQCRAAFHDAARRGGLSRL